MNKYKKYFLMVIAISLFGELYFYPFLGNFRFSGGVLALSLVLLFDDELNVYKLSIFTGIGILLLRFFIDYINPFNNTIMIIKNNLPGSLYYTMFGVFAQLLAIRKNRDDNLLILLSLFSIDVFCNIIEATLRNSLSKELLHYILIVGIIRSILSLIIFRLFKNQELIIRKREHQERYIQLNTFVSSIQAEVFYLKKSMVDIEKVMSKSYSLYENNKNDKDIRDDALDIAREVHEIKKDYLRVLSGFDNSIKNFEKNDSMSFKDIIFIIENNVKRYIYESDKKIEVHFKIYDNLQINKYYPIFTILNNLINNSIEAIDYNGRIDVVEKVELDNIIMSVSDDGKGIDSDLIPYLFNPGFTTKFDERTGNQSTGIGLPHIKNILDELEGNIEIKPNTNRGTKFIVSIPIISLRRC